jgi:hypothetical protein
LHRFLFQRAHITGRLGPPDHPFLPLNYLKVGGRESTPAFCPGIEFENHFIPDEVFKIFLFLLQDCLLVLEDSSGTFCNGASHEGADYKQQYNQRQLWFLKRLPVTC